MDNSEIAYSEGGLLSIRTRKNYINNNYMHNCCWGSTQGGMVNDKKGGQTIFRRNTLHSIGKGNGFKAGSGGTRVEYNLIYNLYYDTDSSNVQVRPSSAITTLHDITTQGR